MKKKRLKFNLKTPEPKAEPNRIEPVITVVAPVIDKEEHSFKGHGYVINPYGTLIFFDSKKGYVFKTGDERIATHLKKIGYKEVC